MFEVRPLPEFVTWLDNLADKTVRGAIAARIKRLQLGLMGDVQPVGEGVSEMRIHSVPDGASISRNVGRN